MNFLPILTSLLTIVLGSTLQERGCGVYYDPEGNTITVCYDPGTAGSAATIAV